MSLDIGQVGHPEPVGFRGLEAAFDQVSGPVLALVGAGGGLISPAPARTGQAHLAHEALDGASCNLGALPVERSPDLVGAIDAVQGFVVHALTSTFSTSSRSALADGGRFLATQ